jgi:hypothetical protein
MAAEDEQRPEGLLLNGGVDLLLAGALATSLRARQRQTV